LPHAPQLRGFALHRPCTRRRCNECPGSDTAARAGGARRSRSCSASAATAIGVVGLRTARDDGSAHVARRPGRGYPACGVAASRGRKPTLQFAWQRDALHERYDVHRRLVRVSDQGIRCNGGACTGGAERSAYCGACGTSAPRRLLLLPPAWCTNGCGAVKATATKRVASDLATDELNCGAWHLNARSRQLRGRRVLVRTGQTACGTTCTSLQTDPDNCGRCGRMCPGNSICANGACQVRMWPPD